MDRTVRFAKHHTPNGVRVATRRVMLETRNAKLRLTVPVQQRCEYENVYHCAARKTASQWMKALLSDPIVYRHSGLLLYDRRLHNRTFPRDVPPRRVVSSLFASYQRFTAIPKPDHHRAFFVLRDPRDVVVSSYFSTRDSHAPMGDIPRVRKVLREKPVKEGMIYLISHLAETGLFRTLRSWAQAPSADNIRLFRYEDLTGERQEEEVDRLLRHCGITIPPPELAVLLSRHSFSSMRKVPEGTGSISHYRKGKAGDWRNHFDDDIYEAFVARTGDLVELLGYPTDDRSPDARVEEKR